MKSYLIIWEKNDEPFPLPRQWVQEWEAINDFHDLSRLYPDDTVSIFEFENGNLTKIEVPEKRYMVLWCDGHTTNLWPASSLNERFPATLKERSFDAIYVEEGDILRKLTPAEVSELVGG